MSLKELFTRWTYQVFAPGTLLRTKYNAFKDLLRQDEVCLELIADLEEIAYGRAVADWAKVLWLYERLSRGTAKLIEHLQSMNPTGYVDLPEYFRKIDFYARMGLDVPVVPMGPPYVIGLAEAAERPELAGGKAHALGRVATGTGLPVPPGFVVTTSAFAAVLEHNALREEIDKLLRRVSPSDPEDLGEVSARIQDAVLRAEIPTEIVTAMEAAAVELIATGGLLAVRSSAGHEDGRFSFAGQYESVLNVAPEGLLAAYKEVLAAKYSAKALTYRVLHGVADQEAPMAVLVLPMVEARAAGVIYTEDPDCAAVGPRRASVYAVPGIGVTLVGGALAPEVTSFLRTPAGLGPAESSGSGVLSAGEARSLVTAALELEGLFGRPQDVEWAIDTQGRMSILQSRAVCSGEAVTELAPDAADTSEAQETETAEVLLENMSQAAPGVAAGPVYLVDAVLDVAAVPEGAVLVIRTLTPTLARLMGRVAAVVAGTGSRASHFASVAREFGLPVLVDGHGAFETLQSGQEVTVDADHGRILKGRAETLLARAEHIRANRPASLTVRRLEAILPHVASLTLTDPESEGFSAARAQSLHDLVRFVHEKSVAEMFELAGVGGRGIQRAKKLETRLPIVLYVLDLDGGLFESAREKKTVTPDDITSVPMWALWHGLSAEDVAWSDHLVHQDWNEFDRVSGGIFAKDAKFLASYAIIAQDYAHLMIRFGYHFSVVDCLCGTNPQANYVTFRFKGGGGSFHERELRIGFLAEVLERFGFQTWSKGDMLDARLAREPESEMQKRLAMLGYLLAATRLMDMGMDEQRAREMVDRLTERLQGYA